MPLVGVASVHPVTLRPEIDVELLTVDCDPTGLTDAMLRCLAGSTGAEDLAPAHLTLSLGNSILIAPMTVFGPSVKPVPKGLLDLILFGTKLCSTARVSLYLTPIG